jgi:hypothetical protein
MEREQNGIKQVVVEVLPDGRMNRRSTTRYLGRTEQTQAIWALKSAAKFSIRNLMWTASSVAGPREP